MSEPESDDQRIAGQLSRFTPDRGALDRDALIFAAGRATANKHRGWKALAGALAASQLLTLVMLWPRAAENRLLTIANTTTASNLAANTGPEQSVGIETSPFQLLQLQHELLAVGHEPARLHTAGPPVPDEPPLRACSPIPPGLLN